MAVTTDIVRTWRGPRAVMRDHLANGQREDRALIFLMAACLVLFIVRWPSLAREAAATGAELPQLAAYALFGVMIVLPLAMYALAALIWVPVRLALPGLALWQVRLALFWSLLAASPAAVLWGLAAGLIGPGPQVTLTGAVWAGAVLVFLVLSLLATRQRRAS